MQTIFLVINFTMQRKLFIAIIILILVFGLFLGLKTLIFKKDTVSENGVFVKRIDYYECKNEATKIPTIS